MAKEKTTERDIIINAISDLCKISQKEFRGGYSDKSFAGNNIVETYVPDSRRQYCQLIDFISDLLLPKFNEPTKEIYEKIQEEIEKIVKKKNNNEMSDEDFISYKLKLSRKLFQHLSILLNELKWLKKKTEIG